MKLLSIALLAFYCSLSSCAVKQVTVKDESGSYSECLVLNPSKGETFKDGRNHIYTIK